MAQPPDEKTYVEIPFMWAAGHQGVLHHVIIRGIERRKIFSDDKDN